MLCNSFFRPVDENVNLIQDIPDNIIQNIPENQIIIQDIPNDPDTIEINNDFDNLEIDQLNSSIPHDSIA